MIKRKCLLILLFLIICIGAVSAVSANDLNGTQETASENDVISSSDVGTFSDLANLFKNAEEVNITRDYAYNPETDWKLDDDYTLAIQIDDYVEVNGNNHVIYGNGARVFYIDLGGDVTIKNLTFINSDKNPIKQTTGGTIYNDGELKLINCNFYNSSAINDGGAVANCGDLTVCGCNFINCTVTDIEDGFGGAISSFNELHVEKSYFGNNFAQSGGAIGTLEETYITDSIFGSESQPNRAIEGGAVYNDLSYLCDISNSYFINNYADYGGALFDCMAYNCRFSNNTSPKGKNVYKGVVINCTGLESELQTVYSNGSSIKAGNMTFKYNEDKYLEVKVTSLPNGEILRGAAVVLYIDESNEFKEITDEEGVAHFQVSGLPAGTYQAKISMFEDYINTSVAQSNIVIKKGSASIKASKLTAAYKNGASWKIALTDSLTGDYIANAKITLKVYTGKKYKTYTVWTNSKGVASFKTSKLSPGTHKVVLSFSNSNYNLKTATSSVKIIKPKALIFTVSKKTRREGAYLSIIVKYKSSKKPVNGVKLKLFIYTGKKYKTVTLKSKTYLKYKGAAGYATNALSVGTHKVVIKPVDIKYKGSKTTSMTIKKSAKKYPSWTRKI